jgi:uncharacterized protein (TIGR02391 family)
MFNLAELNISEHAVSLFASGFHRDAIRHEAQDLLTELADRSGRSELDGQSLVQSVLADDGPQLALTDLSTAKERNEHSSLRYLMLGVTAGVRNTYSHDVRTDVPREEAALWLILMGRLREQIERLDRVYEEEESSNER